MPPDDRRRRHVLTGFVLAAVLLVVAATAWAGVAPALTSGTDDGDQTRSTVQTQPASLAQSTDRAVHVVAFVTEDDAGRCDYEFTTDGAVGPVTESPYLSPSGNEIRATSNFDIDDTDDGQRVAGSTGNGYGDMFVVGGAVTGASIDCEGDDDQMWAELDGERVSTDELLERTGGDPGAVSVTYEGCSTVTIEGEGEYTLEINTEYYGPDGITSLNYGDTVTLPETVNVSDLDDDAVTDIPIQFTTVLDDGEIAAEQSNPNFDECWVDVEHQWADYLDSQDGIDDSVSRTVAFVTSDGADRCDYEFTSLAEPDPLEESPYLSPSGNEVRATSNFDVDETDGGDWHVTGSTGNGYGDAYKVGGAITSASIDCTGDGEMWAEVAGERVTIDQLVNQDATAD